MAALGHAVCVCLSVSVRERTSENFNHYFPLLQQAVQVVILQMGLHMLFSVIAHILLFVVGTTIVQNWQPIGTLGCRQEAGPEGRANYPGIWGVAVDACGSGACCARYHQPWLRKAIHVD